MRKKGLVVLAVIFLLTIVIYSFSTIKSGTNAEFKLKYAVFSLKIPDNLTFAGEKVPVNYFDVREGLDREIHVNTYWQSQTIFFIKRANRYFPTIEKILKENGVPSDFKYLAVAESGLTNCVSPSNAAGFWQFLRNTGIENGLEINDQGEEKYQVDERYHLEKSTEAACRFLKDAYATFGSWAMAAAAYNMGKPGLLKLVKVQKENSYYNLLLSEETSRYVYRILAIKMIIENPDQFGFHLSKNDMYPPFEYTEVTVDSSISDMATFAKSYNINYKLLKTFNPWLRSSKLTNKGKKKYVIKIPPAGFREQMYQGYSLETDSIILNK